jgi:hypothetical protein
VTWTAGPTIELAKKSAALTPISSRRLQTTSKLGWNLILAKIVGAIITINIFLRSSPVLTLR